MFMKLLNSIKKNYTYINKTFLFLFIYIISYPLFANFLEKIVPGFTKCPYFYLKGNPCPFCGGTKFLINISELFVNFKYIFNFFGIFFSIILLEIIFRIYNIIIIKKGKLINKVFIIDIITHIILIIILIIYIIIFFN